MLYKQAGVILLLMLFSTTLLLGQNNRQKALETKRQQILKELKQINELLFSNQREEKSLLTRIEDLSIKMSFRQNLIAITNQQANLLTRKINTNQKQITSLRAQLGKLKKDYAAMIMNSYKSKWERNRVLFLLSSENFKQAYKRLQYIKQYTKYQKQQAEIIKQKTTDLQKLNLELSATKKEKEQLIIENKKEKEKIELELKQRETLINSLQSNSSKYKSQIKKKRQEIKNIDKEIDRLIKIAIATSNKKAGKKASTGKFVLTPEAKKLAADFEDNKGKIGWPVKRGVVKIKFGKQPSLIDKSIIQNYKGIYIATEKNAKVKAIFNGKVSAIQKIKYGNPVVMIRHGNYLSVYMNITNIRVKKGDIVSTGQVIGEVYNNSYVGQALLGLRIHRDSTPLNPESWLVSNNFNP